MSAASSCACPCPDPEVVAIPGTAGANGAAGANGLSAFTVVVDPGFTTPAAVGSNSTIPVGFSGWMAVGQNIYVEGAGIFEVVSFPSSTSVIAEYLDYAGNTNFLVAIPAGAQVSPSGTQPPLSAALPTAITDNSTGTASNTVAAGAGVQTLSFPHTFIAGTAAVEPVTTYVMPFKFKILSWVFVTEVLLVGAAGSRVANMEIDAVNVGTVPSTITIPIANATVGTVTTGTAVAGANTGNAGQSFSIEIAAGGTEFSAGRGTFIIAVQNMDSADAIASLADHVNDLIVSLT